MYLGGLAGNPARMLALRPEAEADTGGRASGAPRTLVCGGATDLLDQKGIDAAPGVEARDAGESAVDQMVRAIS